jgi:deoxycytidine triphosphate deaminase
MEAFQQLAVPAGYLTDKQITKCLNSGHLLEKGTWDKTQIRHASYTLRLGSRIELARASDALGSTVREMRLVTLTKGKEYLDLQPGDTALLYSLELLRFPSSILGFTVARGLLFAEALCPENTYVDPGFTGPIYTTVTNVSNRVIQVHYEMPLARLFFYRLAEDVDDGYRAGSALGIAQQLTSVRAVPFGSAEELRKANDSQLRESVRLIPLGGVHAAELFQREHKRTLVSHQRLMAVALIWPSLLVAANYVDWIKQNVGGFLSNVIAGLVTAVLVWAIPYIVKWVRDATD